LVSPFIRDINLLSVASASIIAKVTRDRLMNELDLEYPQYLWHKNSGYGTKEHIDAIKRFGPCKHHRKSFLTKILA
jgi:ribonuclease HII